jgi:hypothetical protein
MCHPHPAVARGLSLSSQNNYRSHFRREHHDVSSTNTVLHTLATVQSMPVHFTYFDLVFRDDIIGLYRFALKLRLTDFYRDAKSVFHTYRTHLENGTNP